MDLSLYNPSSSSGTPVPGPIGTAPNGVGVTSTNGNASAAAAAALNANNGGVGGNRHSMNVQIGGDDNANFGSSQYSGVPLSAASLNAMMAGAGGGHGQAAAASALNPSLASQYSAAAGMFPSSMIGSNGMGLSAAAAGASMFPGGGGAMGGMGVGVGMGVGGMNGMSINPNALGLSSASTIQNPAFMAGRAPFLLSNGGNMGINGAIGGQLSQAGNAMVNLNGSSLLTQLPNNGDRNGPGNDKLGLPSQDPTGTAINPGATGAAVPQGAQGANGIPTFLSKYYNLHQNLPAVLMDNEPIERPYRDHALVPEDPMSRNAGRKTAGGKEKGGGSNFPAKLHEILSRTDITDIISWSPHGRAWRVLKPKAFEEKVIPKYFRHCKYNSFTRQVNGWGFRRITQGPDHNAYFHELFLRGLPHLCKRMRRLTASNNSRSDLVSSIEPDFYSMSKISPLPAIGCGSNGKLFPEDGVNGLKNNTETSETQEESGQNEGVSAKNSPDSSRNEIDGNSLHLVSKLDDTDKAKIGMNNLSGGDGTGPNTVVTPEMLNEMQQMRGGATSVSAGAGDVGGPGDPSPDGNSNDISHLDSVARHQLLQAQYLNNMRQDSLQQQILAQQSFLSSLQGHHPGGLSQLGGGIGVGVTGMGMGMGIPSGAQMPSLMGAGAPMTGPHFPMNGNQGALLGGSNKNSINPGSNLPFY